VMLPNSPELRLQILLVERGTLVSFWLAICRKWTALLSTRLHQCFELAWATLPTTPRSNSAVFRSFSQTHTLWECAPNQLMFA